MQIGDTVTTETELRALPAGTEFIDGRGRPWDFGSEQWSTDLRERHLVVGLIPNLPMHIRMLRHPAETSRPDLVAEADRILRLSEHDRRWALLDLLVAADHPNGEYR
ncbi:hypothetical protein [Leifsonia sp. Leaf264]|uniref:hypothetical protein n=1 Tax=Leifsonia sp. Leaf264 TaxID=1736314 RepID=UPI000700A37A|nr:hypothetical protein [Leifsonia sp. Leaf264]KQO98618.1 hypothetical protein ASF30_11185 [Leifsonia sp. Leaf264]